MPLLSPTALFFGDSFVSGYGDPTGRGWVEPVADLCRRQGIALDVHNCGVPGDTSPQVAFRWEEVMTGLPNPHDPAQYRAIFSFGANDSIRDVPFGESVTALVAMIDDAKARGFGVFVLGPAPVGEVGPDQYLRALSSAFAELCATRDVPFVPVHEILSEPGAWHDEATGGDGSHPQTRGYEQFAEIAVEAGLIEWIKDPDEFNRPTR